MSVNIRWTKPLSSIEVTNRFVNDKTYLFFYNELFRIMSKYVPRQTGTLMESVKITKDGVLYTQFYAALQYYGVNFNHPTGGTGGNPLATAKWAEVAINERGDEIARSVAAYMKRC